VTRFAAAVLLPVALLVQPPRPRVELLRSTGGLPAHIAGAFQRPIGFQQADDGRYYVFDRRAHAVYTIAGDTVTKIIEVGHGEAIVYPGTYTEFLWSKGQQENTKPQIPNPKAAKGPKPEVRSPKPVESRIPNPESREARKRLDAERKKQQRAAEALQKRIADLEGRIAEREAKVKDLEATMSAPGFYEDRDASKHAIEQHQTLMWEVGDLMAQWEALQEHAAQSES